MSVCLLLIYDGRVDCLLETVATLRHLGGIDATVVVDDSDHELGFAGAVAEGWRRVLALEPRPDYVFHLEADFKLLEPVPLDAMVWLLETHPYIAQVSLKRQAWSAEEIAAGGIVEANPDAYIEDRHDDRGWTEHRRYLTTNPSLYRTGLCERGWPQVPESEGMFTLELLEDPTLRFAIWGGKYDAPRVEHIGHERTGVGY